MSKVIKERKNRSYTIDDAIELAESRGGKCLSSNYFNPNRKLNWECYIGHKFSSTFNSVFYNETWCPKCIVYVSEEICRNVMETLFETYFIKRRPEWLGGLELDGYNEELNIAFEYDGEQHHKFIKHFHRTEDNFKAQQARDAEKNILCEKEGIILIRIPYTVRNPDIADYIRNQLIEKDIEIPNDIEIDYKMFTDIYTPNINKYQRVKKIIEDRGMELLDDVYISSRDKMQIKCQNDHLFERTPDMIYALEACPQCQKYGPNTIGSIKERARKYGYECLDNEYIDVHGKLNFRCNRGNHTFISNINTIYVMTYQNLSWCRHCRKIDSGRSNADKLRKVYKIAEDHGGKCLETEFIDRKTPMRFECAKKHNFLSTASHIVSGAWCHSCKTGKHDIQDMNTMVAKYDGVCISTEYVNTTTNLDWKCKKGHIFSRKPQYIRAGKGFCMKCKENGDE